MPSQLPRHLLLELLHQGQQETRCLAEISNALNHSFDLTQLLSDICSRVCDLLRYRACSVMLAEADHSALAIRGYAGMDPDYVSQLNSRRAIRLDDRALSGGPSGQAYLRNAPVAVTNIYQEQQFYPWLTANPGFSAMIALPLEFRGQTIGVLNCYSAAPHEYSMRERELLTTIASQAAVAIGIVQLIQFQQEQMRQHQALAQGMQQQRDRLLQARQTHDRLTTVVLTGGDIHTVTRTLADLVQNPAGVLDDQGQMIAAYGPGGEPALSEWQGQQLERTWDLQPADRETLDLRPLHLDPDPKGGFPFPRVVAPVTAGDSRLGYVILAACQGPLADLHLAALEHASTVIALGMVHAQALFEAEQRLRGDLLDELLRGQNISDAYIRRRFEQLGYRAEGVYQVLLVQIEGPTDTKPGPQAEVDRRRLLALVQQVTSARNRQSMVVHRNGLFSVLWPLQAKGGQHAAAQSTAKSLQEALQGHYPERRIMIGVGRACEELKRLRDSFEEALAALQVLQRLNSPQGVLAFADMGIYRILLQTSSAEHLLDFSRDTLQPIRAHDTQWKSDLEVTLRTYLQSQMNTHKTAEALFVHPNTVIYRLRKLEQVCNFEVKDLQQLLRFQLALMIQEITGRS